MILILYTKNTRRKTPSSLFCRRIVITLPSFRRLDVKEVCFPHNNHAFECVLYFSTLIFSCLLFLNTKEKKMRAEKRKRVSEEIMESRERYNNYHLPFWVHLLHRLGFSQNSSGRKSGSLVLTVSKWERESKWWMERVANKK